MERLGTGQQPATPPARRTVAAAAPEYILGISAWYHDATAALLHRGRVVAAAAEERFSRLKHDSGFPAHAVDFCLQQAGIEPSDLAAVAFYEQPHVKFTRVLASTLAGFPRSWRPFAGAMRSWMTEKLWLHGLISRRLNLDPALVHTLPHHLSHAAQAFAASPFDDAAVLIADAVGEWSCVSIAHGRRSPEPELRTIESRDYPRSLGLFYAAMTAFLGFRPNDGECSTMALAAFGQPRYLPQIRRILQLTDDGDFHVDEQYLNLLAEGDDLFRPALRELLGEPRTSDIALPFDAFADAQPDVAVNSEAQHYADLAASVQQVLEDAMLSLCRRARRLTGSRRLCLAGGVALNAVCNRRLLREAGFDDIFIPPDPGDGGAAIGAALQLHAQLGGDWSSAPHDPFLGEPADAPEITPLLRHADPAEWSAYMLPGARAVGEDGLSIDELPDDESLAAHVAAALAAGHIVGWVQGRFEMGPRALGNRSVLADPSNLAVARRLREIVKPRASFRPFALSITEGDARRALELPHPTPLATRWMQTVAAALPDAVPHIRAALHVDHTTRPQVLRPEDNPRFHALLEAFGRHRRFAALLNTSLNEDGYPLTATATEALLMLARTDMDMLVVGRTILTKSPEAVCPT